MAKSKLLSLCLAFVLALSLAACGSDPIDDMIGEYEKWVVEVEDLAAYDEDAENVMTVEADLTREQFAGLVGHPVTIAAPASDGTTLIPTRLLAPQDKIYDPLYRLELLSSQSGAGSLLAFEKEDFLSVSVQGNLAVVNTRKGFFDKLNAFTNQLSPADRARMHVFSIVNTLALYPDIHRVWILEDGQRIEQSLDMIYLGNAFYPNPGLNLVN